MSREEINHAGVPVSKVILGVVGDGTLAPCILTSDWLRDCIHTGYQAARINNAASGYA